MAQTAIALIRELSERVGDLVISTPNSGGTASLFDPDLLQYFPQPLQQFNGWVYCTQGSQDAGNRGLERRAQQWRPDQSLLQLYSPGFPSPITGGEYEIGMRFPRRRKMAALNSAIS